MLTTFIDQMNKHWVQTLKLASSKALVEGWQQLEQAACISAGAKHWQVVQLPTGSGKTEALKVLCSMQDLLQHPGVLIVTKFRKEADKLAEGINKLASWHMARSVHQEAPGHFNDLASSAVLVTTHAAYRLALQEIADTGVTSKADRLLTYNCGKRAWIIIDEAIDWADSYSLNLGNLRAMSGDLARAMQGASRAAAEQLYEVSCRLTNTNRNGRSDQPVESDSFDSLTGLDLHALRNGVSAISEDALAKWIDVEPATDTEPAVRIERPSKAQYLDQLAELQTIARIGHGWTSRRGGLAQLHSSRSLIGLDGMRGIILDATAEIDPTYSVMRQQVVLLPRPPGIRTYQNVTLHASYGHKVGKEHLRKNAEKEWAIVWGDLSKRLAGKRILVCAHKDARHVIEQYGPQNEFVYYDNWGNLDGRNDYNQCEAAILFGLPYLDDIEPAQRFIAHRGQQSHEWFGGNRRYEEHADIRTALGVGFVIRSVVQAINRTRCRNAIDAEGNCERTDIYLLLPAGNTGTAVVRAIQQQMPGIRIADWLSGAMKRKARKVPTEVKLTCYFESAGLGHYTKSDIVSTLRINPSSLERMTAKLRHQSTVLARKLTACGVRYHSQTGRGKEAYFIKQSGSYMSLQSIGTSIVLDRREAAMCGLSRFYTGRSCREGHRAERFVGNRQCVVCNAQKARQRDLLRGLREPSYRMYRNTLRRTGMTLTGRASPAYAVGCDHTKLRDHIEARFRPGMTWERYRQWEVDHIEPLGLARDINDLVRRCHYTNLQPLWRRENRMKGGA